MRSGPANLRAYAALAAAALVFAATGCGGGGERRDASGQGGPYSVDVVRARFPAHQHLADKPVFVMTVRNSGDTTIPDLTVTLHGFSDRTGDSAQADSRKLVWLIDEEPPGAVTAVADTWAAGALAPGRDVTLRWHVTPVLAGTHTVQYAIAPDLAGPAQARVAGGGRPRGKVTVRVDGRPAQARVDPRSGRVVGE